MTTKAQSPRITLPTATMIELAGFLTDADEFLHSSPTVTRELEHFLEQRSHRHLARPS